MLEQPVEVTFDGGVLKKQIVVDYKLMRQVHIKSPSTLSFTISARDVSLGGVVNVNGSKDIVIEPSKRKQSQYVLFVGATGTLFFIRNLSTHMIIIVYKTLLISWPKNFLSSSLILVKI